MTTIKISPPPGRTSWRDAMTLADALAFSYREEKFLGFVVCGTRARVFGVRRWRVVDGVTYEWWEYLAVATDAPARKPPARMSPPV